MTFLNVPVEWLSLGFEWTWMLLFEDVQQGVFYSTLFCFWIIFCGEHLMVSTTLLAHYSAFLHTFMPVIHFLKTTNPLGPKSAESALGVLVAGWAGGLQLICSPCIWPEWKVRLLLMSSVARWLYIYYLYFFKNQCASFPIKGRSLEQPFLQRLGIRHWDKGGSILQTFMLSVKSLILLNENTL